MSNYLKLFLPREGLLLWVAALSFTVGLETTVVDDPARGGVTSNTEGVSHPMEGVAGGSEI